MFDPHALMLSAASASRLPLCLPWLSGLLRMLADDPTSRAVPAYRRALDEVSRLYTRSSTWPSPRSPDPDPDRNPGPGLSPLYVHLPVTATLTLHVSIPTHLLRHLRRHRHRRHRCHRRRLHLPRRSRR